MGLFTEIGAALSYNFASGQISKEDEKYVYHQIGRDVSKEEKKYLKFLDKKYGTDKFYIFRLSKILQKYYKEHGEISYKKISKQTGCEKSALKKVMKIMTGYFIKINGENIDYAINNPLKSTTEKDSKIDEENKTEETMVDVSDQIIFDLFKNIGSHPELIAKIQQLQQNKYENGYDLSRDIIVGMIQDNPQLYGQFRNVIDQHKDHLVRPIEVAEPRPSVELSDIATTLISDPNTNDGVVANQTPIISSPQSNTDTTQGVLTNNDTNKNEEENKEQEQQSSSSNKGGKGGAAGNKK